MSEQAAVTTNLRTRPSFPLRVGLATAWLLVATAAADAQVMIVAPHPDDEALFASGIVYQAHQSGKNVKVVLATNGDCEVPTIGPIRQQESVAAMGVLGLAPEDVIFLGYPDCGLNQLYGNYSSQQSVYTSAAGFSSTYASEGLGHTDYHSYTTGAPAPYNGYWLTEDLKTLFRTYKPQDVYVTSAYDDHPDHYVLNFFVGDALLSLIRSDPTFQPTLHDALVHAPCELCDPTYQWPMPTFTPTVPFPMPPALGTTPLGWSEVESVTVPAALQSSSAASNPKDQVIARYASQGGPGAWLESFVKVNEIFWKWELWANLALKGTATASSVSGPGTTADRVNDASVVGSPRVSGASGGKGEWVSAGQLAGAWVQVTWPTAVAITRIVLHDRPEPAQNISSGTLTFSDGLSVAVGALPAGGVGLSVSFPSKNVTWMRFTVNGATGASAGLAEMEAYGPDGPKLPWPGPGANTSPTITSGPTATPSTINDRSTSALTASASDADGDPLTYSWTTTGGQIQGTGSSVTFVPPAVTSQTSFRVDVSVDDGRGGTATRAVTVTVTPASTVNALGDLAIDFGAANGLWLITNPSGTAPQWSKLRAASPSHMAMGDVDGNGQADLIASFPGAGVWIWANNARWMQLHSFEVSDITVGDFDGNGVADVALSFPGYGLYARMNNLAWVRLHSLTSGGMAAGNLDNDAGHRAELIVNFPGAGVWVWTNNTTWMRLNGTNAAHIGTGDLDGNGRADVVLDFAGSGLWTWMNHSTWVQRHRLNSLETTTGNLDGDAGGRSDLVMNFAGSGVWALMNNSTWVNIHPQNANQMTTLDLDANGRADLVLSLPGAGIWIWMNHTSWMRLHPLIAEDIAGGRVDSR